MTVILGLCERRVIKQTNNLRCFIKKCWSVCVCVDEGKVVQSKTKLFVDSCLIFTHHFSNPLAVHRNATHVCFSKGKESHEPTGEPDSLNSLCSRGRVSRFHIRASSLAQRSNERGGDGSERSCSLNVSNEHLNNWTIQTKRHVI